MAVVGPPRFAVGEIARVVAVTGDERDDVGEPFDAHRLIGQEVSVEGAAPTPAQDGWIIHVWVESIGAIVDVPERGLHRIEGAARGRPWRDDILLTLVAVEAEATARRAVDVLRGIDGVDTVDWRTDAGQVTLWVHGIGDVLDVYGRILDLADRGAGPDETGGWYPDSWFDGAWEHDNDESSFISARWTRVEGAEFLTPAVREAEVSYRRWMSPRRRTYPLKT